MTANSLTLDLLRMHKSTDGVSAEGLARIAASAEVQRVPAGTVIHQAGHAIPDLILVMTGRLRLVFVDSDETERTIQYLGRDDQFGALSLGLNQKLPIGLVADTKSQILRIPTAEVRQIAVEVPLWKRNLLRSAALGMRSSVLGDRPRKAPRIVSFLHASPQSRSMVRSIVAKLRELGEPIAIFSDEISAPPIGSVNVHSVIDQQGRLQSLDQIRSRVVEFKDCNRVILDFSIQNAFPYSDDLLHACDCVFWCVTNDVVPETVEQLSDLHKSHSGLVSKQRWVSVLKAAETVAPHVAVLKDLVGRDFKFYLPGNADDSQRLHRQGLMRLIHELRDIRIGLTLGGGAARGMAHLGALQVLDSAGLVFDDISGTSVGAMVGSLYAAGMPPDVAATSFARDLQPSHLERLLPGGERFYLVRNYRRNHWDRMLRHYLFHWRLEQLPIPMRTVSVDLIGATQVVRREGDAVHAILESINLPGLSTPILRDGMALVDGGVLNVLPADVLVNDGVDYVVAVNVSSQLSPTFAGNDSEMSTEQMVGANAFETIARVLAVQQKNMRAFGSQPADFTIAPDVSEVDISAFQDAVEIARLGTDAAQEVVTELKSDLAKIDPCLVMD